MVKDSGLAVRLDSVLVEFGEERLAANAGVLWTSSLLNRLGLERLVEESVDLGQRPGAAQPGRKVCSLVHVIAFGAASIDDCDVLRCGGTEALCGQRVMAPATLGTFLRSFSFGQVRQLDLLAESIRRLWSGRGALRFVQELLARVRRAGGNGVILIRAEAAFWNKKLLAYLAAKGCRYSVAVRLQRAVAERIALIPEQAARARSRLSRLGRLRTRRKHAGSRAAGRPPCASPRPGGPGRALRLLAPLRVCDQPQRAPAQG